MLTLQSLKIQFSEIGAICPWKAIFGLEIIAVKAEGSPIPGSSCSDFTGLDLSENTGSAYG